MKTKKQKILDYLNRHPDDSVKTMSYILDIPYVYVKKIRLFWKHEHKIPVKSPKSITKYLSQKHLEVPKLVEISLTKDNIELFNAYSPYNNFDQIKIIYAYKDGRVVINQTFKSEELFKILKARKK